MRCSTRRIRCVPPGAYGLEHHYRSSRVAHTRHAACASNTKRPQPPCLTHTTRARTISIGRTSSSNTSSKSPPRTPSPCTSSTSRTRGTSSNSARSRGSRRKDRTGAVSQRRRALQTGRGAPHRARGIGTCVRYIKQNYKYDIRFSDDDSSVVTYKEWNYFQPCGTRHTAKSCSSA